KTVAYAPFSVWVYLNGNKWAKRLALKQGLEVVALGNGFAACADQPLWPTSAPARREPGSGRPLSAGRPGLPSRFTVEDRARGYGYELAFRELEISDTRVFDRPAAGRAWCEQTPISSRLGALIGLRSLVAASAAAPRDGSTPRSSTEVSSQRSRSTTAPRR